LVLQGYTLRWNRWNQVTFGFPFIPKADYIFSRLPEEKVLLKYTFNNFRLFNNGFLAVQKISMSGLSDVFGATTNWLIVASVVVTCLLFMVLVYKAGQKVNYAHSLKK
jgi:hypothetical protein